MKETLFIIKFFEAEVYTENWKKKVKIATKPKYLH